MGKAQQYFLVLLLIPSFAEIINARDYSFAIPGSPFSLGRITFILVGLIGIMSNRHFYFKSNTVKGLFLIFLGSIVGGLLSDQIALSLSRSIGSLILFVGALGMASLIDLKFLKRSIDIFFVSNFIFWSNYVYQLTLTGGLSFNSYSQLFLEKEAVNHHLVGVNISVSSIFIALRFFYNQNQLKLPGFLIIFNGVFVCFLSETRSNLLFLTLALLIIMFFSKMKVTRLISIIAPVIIGMFIFLSMVAKQNDALYQRFDATDEDYQERTTGMRLGFIEGFFTAFGNNPFGRGVFGAEIGYGSVESTMLHNQYLTFVLSGGILALFGIIFWLGEFIKLFFIYVKSDLLKGKGNYAYIISMFTFILTLFTIEYSGLLFYLYISILIYLSERTIADKINSNLMSQNEI